MKQIKERSTQFTLIELLVVIAIIAILCALLFPALNGVMQRSKELKAKVMANAIVTACKAYESMYGVLPIEYSDSEAGEELDSDGYKELIELLSGFDGPDTGTGITKNARNARFLEVPGSYGEPPSGATTQEEKDKSGYVDQWGREFVVAIDCNYDGDVESFHGESKLKGKVFVYSKGNDGQDLTKDDIRSWK